MAGEVAARPTTARAPRPVWKRGLFIAVFAGSAAWLVLLAWFAFSVVLFSLTGPQDVDVRIVPTLTVGSCFG